MSVAKVIVGDQFETKLRWITWDGRELRNPSVWLASQEKRLNTRGTV